MPRPHQDQQRAAAGRLRLAGSTPPRLCSFPAETGAERGLPEGLGSFEVTRCIFKAPRRAGLGQKRPAARSPASPAQPAQLLPLPGAPASAVLGFGKASVPPERLPWVRDSILPLAPCCCRPAAGTPTPAPRCWVIQEPRTRAGFLHHHPQQTHGWDPRPSCFWGGTFPVEHLLFMEPTWSPTTPNAA